MSDVPQVSIVIPTYNRAHTVMDTLDSVFAQTFTDYEILVVDDASTDNTAELLGAIEDSRLSFISLPENNGAPYARNEGIKKAEGSYVAFLDSDDTWSPTKLSKQLEVMHNSPQKPGLIYTAINLIKTDGTVRHVVTPDETKRGSVFEPLLAENFMGSTSSVLVKTELLRQVEGFDLSLQSCQDWDLFLRLARLCTFDYVAKPLTNCLEHEGERISNDIAKRLQGREALESKYKADLTELRSSAARFYFDSGALHFEQGNLGAGRALMLKSLRQVFVPKALVLYVLSFISPNALERLRKFSFKARSGQEYEGS